MPASLCEGPDELVYDAIQNLQFAALKHILSWVHNKGANVRFTREQVRYAVGRLVASGRARQIPVAIGTTRTIYTIHSLEALESSVQSAEQFVLDALAESGGFLSRLVIERGLRESGFPPVIPHLAVSRLALRKTILLTYILIPNGQLRFACIRTDATTRWGAVKSVVEASIDEEGCGFLMDLARRAAIDIGQGWLVLRNLLYEGRIGERILAFSSYYKTPIRVYYMPGRADEIEDCQNKQRRRQSVQRYLGICEQTLERLDVGDPKVGQAARSILERYLAVRGVKGASAETVAAAAVYVAARAEGQPIPVSRMSELLGIRTKTLLRHSTAIARKLEIERHVSKNWVNAYVSLFVSHLNLADSTANRLVRDSVTLLQSIADSAPTGCSPKTTACAAIYIAGVKAGLQLTQKSVAAAGEVSEVGLRNVYKRLKSLLEKESERIE